ncbi:15783_t:CDS:2 [Racocetra fulgida]|uniref:15783_t:CDS:1 n=1 Tax=Racocetra fulgida TaxID=60492 RepID=A0A9N9FWT5_9GLOM|nr:15783_t:CDS:2 [Racocetra fulgida]
MENIFSQTSSEAFDKEHSYNSDDKESESEYEEEGLETDNPRMRIGNMYFKGEYDESIGTDLVFCQEPDEDSFSVNDMNCWEDLK